MNSMTLAVLRAYLKLIVEITNEYDNIVENLFMYK